MAALVVWVVMWSFGVKALDSFLVGLFVFIVPATGWTMIKPWFERTVLRR